MRALCVCCQGGAQSSNDATKMALALDGAKTASPLGSVAAPLHLRPPSPSSLTSSQDPFAPSKSSTDPRLAGANATRPSCNFVQPSHLFGPGKNPNSSHSFVLGSKSRICAVWL